jgi:hypothetical protein
MTPTSRTDVLDRAFPAPSHALERLRRRRDRRDRNRRIIEGGVAIVLVVAIVAALAGLVANRRPQVPAGPITPSNVGDLGLAWWGAAVPALSQPIVAGGPRVCPRAGRDALRLPERMSLGAVRSDLVREGRDRFLSAVGIGDRIWRPRLPTVVRWPAHRLPNLVLLEPVLGRLDR